MPPQDDTYQKLNPCMVTKMMPLGSASVHRNSQFSINNINDLLPGPNDSLVYKDDPLNLIWYIKSGSMEVMEGDMVVAILGKFLFYYLMSMYFIFRTFLFSGAGDLVGCDLEDQLANPQRNVINRSGFLVKALTYCELKAIQLDHVFQVRY